MNEAASLSVPHARSGLGWALVPVLLLASSVLGVGSMAYVAAHDPSFSTEPDYYQKAVAWNQTQTQAAENARLGYLLSLPAKLSFGQNKRVVLQLIVRDRSGRLVDGAHVRAEAFSNLAADRVSKLEFAAHAPGVYETSLEATHPGVWNFRVSADNASDHFTAELRSELVPGGTP